MHGARYTSCQLWLGHVGDSRAYLLRNSHLTQLTDDQTLHAQMIREGLMTAEESKVAGGGNVILQALGTGLDVVPTIEENGIPLSEGDISFFARTDFGTWWTMRR